MKSMIHLLAGIAAAFLLNGCVRSPQEQQNKEQFSNGPECTHKPMMRADLLPPASYVFLADSTIEEKYKLENGDSLSVLYKNECDPHLYVFEFQTNRFSTGIEDHLLWADAIRQDLNLVKYGIEMPFDWSPGIDSWWAHFGQTQKITYDEKIFFNAGNSRYYFTIHQIWQGNDNVAIIELWFARDDSKTN